MHNDLSATLDGLPATVGCPSCHWLYEENCELRRKVRAMENALDIIIGPNDLCPDELREIARQAR